MLLYLFLVVILIVRKGAGRREREEKGRNTAGREVNLGRIREGRKGKGNLNILLITSFDIVSLFLELPFLFDSFFKLFFNFC